MKTLQIGMHWFQEDAGGLNRVYYDLLQHLPDVGIEVKGLVAGRPSVIQESQGMVESFAPINSSILNRYLQLRNAVQGQIKNYDLVVSHFALYAFPVLNIIQDTPMVTHFQGPWALECKEESKSSITNFLREKLENICYQRSQHFIVLSDAFKQILHRQYNVPLEKIHVIPAGVDLIKFNVSLSKSQSRSHLGWHPDRPIMLVVRRLARRMGLENLITAMKEVTQHQPDALLLIAGKGQLAEELELQIRELGLEKNVKLLGFISDADLPIAYRAADFSIVPTVALEGFGLIVTESLASGTPVLGTPIGGIPEILNPLSPNLVFEGTEPHHLSTNIIEVLNGTRGLPTSQDCQSYAQKNYNWKSISHRVNEVYEMAVKI